jgi:hypothetical protein
MFCTPEFIFDETVGVMCLFHVLRSRSHFHRYRGPRVPYSCSSLPYSFSSVPTASGLALTFCAPELIFGGTEGVMSSFHGLRYRTNFRQYRGRQVQFSSFALSDSFWTIKGASGPVLTFCGPGLIFGVIEDVRSRFHVLRSRTRIRRFRGRRDLFSYFALPDSFSMLKGASAPIFMFCAPGHVFGCTEGVGSSFHVLCFRTRFQRYRGHQFPF